MSYIEFTAFGAYCEEFIDELVKSDYSVSNISSQSGIYTVRVTPGSYPAIARKAGEYRVKTRVVRRSGIYFTLRRYRKRIGILLGILSFFAIIVLLSNFVWSVRITGVNEVSRWQISEQLSKSGIRPGVHIASFNANLAEIELTLAIEEIAWVSIERTGSRVNVKVSERLENDKDTIPITQPCNVVASHSGQLIRAEVYRGELLYEIGSGINAGGIVVSGITDDVRGGISYVHADAVLIAEAVELIDFYQPYTVFHRARNGHSVNNRSIVFLGRRFGGELNICPHSDHVDYSETVTAPDLFGFPLPLRVLNQNYVFFERVEVTDPPVTALDKLNRQIELYEANFLLGLGAEIIDKQVEYYPDENGIGALIRYVFHIDVAQKRELTISN
jgi:similar to stage IV sporulation protein